ncbi:MAG: hypothetical protein HC867_00580, partial [Bacteroidia bacterium]|nr:hypothetical protein [Bacteroidia bacterium]
SSATATTWNAANGGSLLFGINVANTGGFITTGTTNLNSTNTSYIPDAGSGAGTLTLGSTALNITNSGIIANAQYNGPRSGLSIADFKTQILNQSNWATVDATTGKEIWIHKDLRGIIARGINFWQSKDKKQKGLSFSSTIPCRPLMPTRANQLKISVKRAKDIPICG